MIKTGIVLFKACLLSGLFLMTVKFVYKNGGLYMIDMYIALVLAGRRTCNTETVGVTLVPLKWRTKVLEDLTALGLDADGNPTNA